MNRKSFFSAVLLIAAVCVNLPLYAESDLLSVNLYGYGKGGDALWDQTSWRQTVTLEPGQSAGAGIWNTTDWVNLNTGDKSVVLTTALGFTPLYELNKARNAGPYWWTQTRTTLLGDGNGDLMDGHFNGTEDPYDESLIFDMTLSNMPAYPSYDLIVYLHGNKAQWYNGKGKIIVNGGPEQDFTLQSGEFDGTYTEITNATTPGDYMVFQGLTQSTLSVQIWGDAFSHLGPAGFQIYAADTGTITPQTAAFNALSELKQHVEGTITLTGDQIAVHKSTLDADKTIFGISHNVITAAMDLVETYDSIEGPLWVDGVKRWTDWDRRLATDDNIHWVIYHVMQYIMDYTYTEENLAAYESLLGSFKFGSAENFPNNYMTLTPPSDPEAIYTVSINGSFPKTFGHHTMHWENMPARKPTGAYLLPGSIATVTVPPSMVNAGYQIRVGAHALDLTNKPFYLRLGRSSLAYDITDTETKVINPLGGGIYIEVPYLADAGVVDIQIKNTIRGPYFSHNTVTGHITTLSQWQNTERNHPAPWADFQTEKFMVQVPTSWIYALDDPVTSMADWDKAMDACNDLMGFDHDRGKESSYDQIDVLIDAGALSPGYPTCNNTYNPRSTSNGNSNHYLVRGPQYAPSYHFHELGHGYLFQKFPGETESNVNLLHVPVWNRKFGYDLDTAFYKSSPAHPSQAVTLDDTAIYWMTCFNFVNDVPMTKSEKQYQLRGHAKFVEIARQFGWDVLGDYWRSFNDDYENGISWSGDTDSLLLRLSKAVGYDIRPLFHFWGVHPVNNSSLQADLEAENIRPSNRIYDLLVRIESIVPEDNASFQQFCLKWYGQIPNPSAEGTEAEHGQQWDEYDAGSKNAIVGQIEFILTLYFPDGRPGLDIGPDKITWSGQPVQINPLFKGRFAPTSFAWTAEPDDGVVFTPNESSQSPAVTITKSSGDSISFAVTLTAEDGVTQEQDTMIIDVYDDSCKAAIGKGLPAIYPGDLDENCIIDLHDFAVIAADWLDNGLLAEPIKGP